MAHLKHTLMLMAGLLAACSLRGGGTDNGAITQLSSPATRHEPDWIQAWSTAATDAGSSFNNQTIRTIISPKFSAEEIRVTLSNTFGNSDIRIGNATIAYQLHGPAVAGPGTMPITFHGSAAVVIKAGETVTSDPIRFPVIPFRKLALSYYLPERTGYLTRHFLGMERSYFSRRLSGDKSRDLAGEAFSASTSCIYLLSGIEKKADPDTEVIVAFGDSITDGYEPNDTAIGDDSRYPDALYKRLSQDIPYRKLVIINSGISGNRLLRGAPPFFGYAGPSALSRADRDIVEIPGVSRAIIMIGTNDLGLFPRASGQEVITGLQELTERLHAHGIKVYLGTIPPAKGFMGIFMHGSKGAIAARNEINTWIRGQTLADGVIDFNKAIRDPHDPDALSPAYDSGDHLHPNPRGYAEMASSVASALLTSKDEIK